MGWGRKQHKKERPKEWLSSKRDVSATTRRHKGDKSRGLEAKHSKHHQDLLEEYEHE